MPLLATRMRHLPSSRSLIRNATGFCSDSKSTPSWMSCEAIRVLQKWSNVSDCQSKFGSSKCNRIQTDSVSDMMCDMPACPMFEPVVKEGKFPSLWEGLGEGLRRVFYFVYAGSVNLRITSQQFGFQLR